MREKVEYGKFEVLPTFQQFARIQGFEIILQPPTRGTTYNTSFKCRLDGQKISTVEKLNTAQLVKNICKH
jgi:hypothetical protein